MLAGGVALVVVFFPQQNRHCRCCCTPQLDHDIILVLYIIHKVTEVIYIYMGCCSNRLLCL